MRYLYLLVFLLFSIFSFCQNPYAVWQDQGNVYHFVSVDPVNGTQTNISSIPGMTGLVIPNTTTINTDSLHYIFRGLDGGGNINLYTIDILTGALLNTVQQPGIIVGQEYNYLNDTIYALRHDGGTNYYLSTIDPTTGVATDIAQIPGVTAYVGSTFSLDVNNGEYNFIGFDSITLSYFNIDIQTGNVLNNNPFNGNVVGHRYNCNNDTIYGLWEDQNLSVYYLVALDPVTGSFTTLDSLSGVDGYVSETATLDTYTGEYTFIGFNGPTVTAFKVDVNTASVISSQSYSFNPAGLESINSCGQPPLPIADFTANVTTIMVGDSVDFTDLTQFYPTSWSWDFTGGTPNTSTLQHPSDIQYDSAGCYPVQLIATNNTGSDTAIQTCYIMVVDTPHAEFTADTMLIVVGDTVNFTDLSTGNPTSWSWSFAGGIPATSTSQNPLGIEYNAAGCYQVELTITNQAGNDTETKLCYIEVVAPPIADFTVSNDSIVVSDVVFFTDLSLNNPTSWQWSFQAANPTSSTTQNPINIAYDSAGCFDVSLTVTNLAGSDTETRTCYIYVDEGLAPICDFEASDTTILVGSTIDFTELTQNNITGWSWSFPGALPDTSNLQNPMGILYDSIGCFDVTMWAFNDFGTCIRYKPCYITVQDSINSVTEINRSSQVRWYPNPFSSTIVFQTDKVNEVANIQIINVLGEIVWRETNITTSHTEISRNEWPSGLYFYKVEWSNGEIESGKIIAR